ncbi:MAG: polysaccharide deacetylase family protein [Phreatobacter sp.]
MPWKQDYTISDEVAIADRDIAWPDARRCGFNLVVDLSPAVAAEGITEKSLATPTFHFGMHQGLEQVLALFARLGLRATFAVPALVAKLHPAAMRRIIAGGHEIAANGLLGEDLALLDARTETDRLRQATEILGEVTGSRPAGWYALPRPGDAFATGSVSGRTIDLLIDGGYRYFGNGLADDAPHYWVVDFASRKNLLTLPYFYPSDDRFFLMFPAEGTGLERPDVLLRNWRTEFAAQYRRCRYFSLTVSPARSGWGHRFANLESFLVEATALPGLWNATSAQVAKHWTSVHPAETHLKLEPSIWRSHDGSLD